MKDKKLFKIVVWYRYISNSEQEKDFNVHEIEAYDIQQAVNKAKELYNSRTAIPYSFEYNGVKHEPKK